MKLIKFTSPSGKPIFVNPNKVKAVGEASLNYWATPDSKAVIEINGPAIFVAEDVQTVVERLTAKS
jgi:uncharacterized protein YlzI (FlbEa/FlbD family)